MGCLSLSVQDQTVVDIAVSESCVNGGVSASVQCRNAILSAIATAVGISAQVSVSGVAPDIQVSFSSANITPSVTVGLVCGVSLDGDWQYLQLTDGNIIMIDGQYVQVIRTT